MTQPCACPCLARLGGGVLEHAKRGGNGTEIMLANREKGQKELMFTVILFFFEFQVKSIRLEEWEKLKEKKKRRKERKRVSNPRKSVLIAYECLCLKNYRIDVVVLFFDSLSVTFF